MTVTVLAETRVPIDTIVLGQRIRTDMGDLGALAESIKRHGLLHPVVVTTDRTLVAGHRRMEAARLIGWNTVPVTVVDVDDLLSAERDENAERKDFSPTEAVAIGRLIEERQRPIAIARRLAAATVGGSRNRRSDGGGKIPQASGPGPGEKTRDVAGRAVGLCGRTYALARAVVAAAEAEPQKFGDLPARMDETRNIQGAHREMERRKAGAPAPRHAVHNKSRRRNQTKEMERLAWQFEAAAKVLATIDPAALDAARTDEWVESLSATRTEITRAIKRLKP